MEAISDHIFAEVIPIVPMNLCYLQGSGCGAYSINHLFYLRHGFGQRAIVLI